MALSGLDIYKLLPKKNCKECGFPTCLAFAMQLAAKKAALDKCPYVSEEARQALEGASQPPIKLVSFGSAEKKVEVGDETVLFRHEETFYHPTGIGVLLEDSLKAEEIPEKLKQINSLAFERVGKHVEIDAVALKQKITSATAFADFVKRVIAEVKLAIILVVKDALSAQAALKECAGHRPLLCSAQAENFTEMAEVAKAFGVPLCVSAPDLSGLVELTAKLKAEGVSDLVLEITEKSISAKLNNLTQIRRMSIKKNLRALGYPTLTFTQSTDPYLEAVEASTYIDKYSSIVILKNSSPEYILPLLANRQDIFTDPQKPTQVEAKLYEIGQTSKESPLLVTTNFSITYFTVQSEVESSKVPAYILSVDTEGMSVLTAWAAEKFTSEKIISTLKSQNVEDKLSHHRLIIPGYVAVLSGKLQDESGWQVVVGPKEAAGIPAFLKSLDN